MNTQPSATAHRIELRQLVAAALGLLMVAGVLAMSPAAGAVSPAPQPGKVVSSTSPAPWSPAVMDGYVRTFADLGGVVMSGGNFTTVRAAGTTTDIARSNIVAFEKGTGTIVPFAPSINGEVFKILPTGDSQTVFVAGGFSSVNGQTVRSIVKLDATTGERVTTFNPPSFNGRVHDLFLRNGKLYVTGRFTSVGNQPRTVLAALDPVTGALDAGVAVTFSDPRRNGTLNIYDADITPDGSKLVAIGNFTKINGLARYQIGVVDLTTTPPSVADWQTNQYGDGCASAFESYMRGIDISPDGSYFVVVTTGAYNRTYLCDVAARWNLDRTGTNLMPEWTNYTGGDTFTAVAITDDVVYVGGHQNYVNNPYIADGVSNGAVPRDGLAALDPRAGATLSWNPGRERGWGVYGFQLTNDGLWIGSDTERIAGGQYRPRQAFLPLVGGTDLPTEFVGALPADVYSLGLMQGWFGSTLDRVATHPMSATGTSGAQVDANGTTQWRNVRGAFMVDGKLYTGWSDGSFKVQDFDGTNFGAQTSISLRLDPSSASLSRFSSQDLASVTGMFYDPASGRIYFTKSGTNALMWRSFSPESRIVGAERYTSDSGSNGLNWSGVQSMFLADGKLYTANTSGVLTSRDWNAATGSVVAGTATNVSGPAIDGHDWRARDAFVYAEGGVSTPNAAPTPSFTAACTGVACSFDGTTSTDSDGTITSYAWDFGDASTAGTGPSATHTYSASGTYTVTLTVTDDDGTSADVQQQVAVTVPNQAPTASFTQTCNGLSCTFDGTTSSDPDGTVAAHAWTFGDGATAVSATAAHTFASAGTYPVSLSVTDDDGAVAVQSTNVTVIDPDAVPTATFRAARGSDSNSSSPSVSIPESVEAGDELVLVATQNVAGSTVTAPAGWTLLDDADSAGNGIHSLVWTRTATASDAGATVRLSSSVAAKTSLEVVAYSGASGVSASAKAIETVATTGHTTPTVVATAGSAVISYWADKSNDNTAWVLPVDTTGRVTTVGSGSGHVVATIADSAVAASGTFGGRTATSTGSATKKAVMWTISVAPDTATPNQPPAVSFTSSCAGLVCQFDASASNDADGTISSFAWTFSDGGTATGPNPHHTFATPGTFPVTVTATDDDGATNSSTSSVTVTLGAAPVVAFRAAAGADANSTAPGVTVPSEVAAGDLMVLVATLNSTAASVAGPAGWTLVDSVSSTSVTMQSFVWTRVAGASDAGSTVRITNSVGSKTSLQVLAYSNASAVSASARSVESAAATTHTTPTVAVSTPGSTLVSYWADKSNDNTGWNLPLGVSGRSQTVGTGSGHITAAASDSGSLGTGSVGGLTAGATGAANRKAIMWSIVIAPTA